ncbi:26S proteasome subunit P45 family protein [Edhazardia aedis USNM 41457]|uniref:26S proteasome regulatory subunit 6B homolog n=1 Tax=Edhazardia aedis (strain USNM 41457) TaxID=1003232 RepID=J9DJV8_EDHAE|nr:26S proteasome subunit P45 family protein [Edhazardia aedis USNM 41457]|eukprot:EJW02905.1 26S proteasome subunit P45 family protein [Edhazardia aedis USNM 41457]
MNTKEFKEYFEYRENLNTGKLLKLRHDHLKTEIQSLEKELIRTKQEMERIKSVPLILGQFVELIDPSTCIISSSSTGTHSLVKIVSSVDHELLKPGASVALHRHSNAVVAVLPPESDSAVRVVEEKPDITYQDIGGLDVQKQEIRETVELPLVEHELYQQIGIEPPRGVLLYGPPGTGKTMIVKAVANHTNATFIKVNGSEFVQKYLGEGPRMVRDVFRLARERSPSIVFIDEVDSIASKRYDAATSADREVQRVLLELLNQMDGFDVSENVKVIMATNREDTIDPALLRPGRLDRKIEFPLPDRRQKRLVFAAVTSKMGLADDVDIETLVNRPDRISSADISSICQEAGMLAVRSSRYVVSMKDFEEAYAKVVGRRDCQHAFYY